MKTAYRLVIVGLILFAVTPVGWAAAGEPTDALRERVERVIKVLQQPGEHRSEVRKIAEEIFDFEETARRALGAHWNARSPEERKEFIALFTDLLERAYFGKIDSYQGEKVAYAGDATDGDHATVRTRIVTKAGTEIPVDYRLHRKDGKWLVYDVSIEGVSLVANYRMQFNKVIQTESYPALVQKLRARETEPAASPGPRRAR